MNEEAVKVDKQIENLLQYLDFSIITFISLFLVGILLFFGFLDQTIQNAIPILTVLALGVITSAFRGHVAKMPERAKEFIINWIIIIICIVVFDLLLFLFYPLN